MHRLPERYQAKIKINDKGCWEWQGEIAHNGYGRAWYKGFRYQAHRLVYWLIGSGKFNIDDTTKEIDHLCENRCCVNPEHHEVVTHQVNIKRIKRRRKKIDKNGQLVNGKSIVK